MNRRSSTSFAKLIARLETATRPDREIDHAIDELINGEWHYYARDYTASIDAALTLVPSDHDWIVASVNGHVGGTPYACCGDSKEHFGETPVLSLCIAALKARAAVEEIPPTVPAAPVET